MIGAGSGAIEELQPPVLPVSGLDDVGFEILQAKQA
jgi:hypothetical protein